MTHFGQLLMKAVRPNTKFAPVKPVCVVSRTVSFEEKMKKERGFVLGPPPAGTLFNPTFYPARKR